MKPPSLLGVWRLESMTNLGEKVHTGQTHLVVHEDLLFEVWPGTVYYDDRPGPERSYSLVWVGEEGRLEVRSPDRPSSFTTLRIFGDELQARLGSVLGRPPDSFDDEHGLLTVYQRERDPEVIARVSEPPVRVSKPKRTHAQLGELTHDAGLDWWETTIRFGEVDGVRFHLTGSQTIDDSVLDGAAAIVDAVSCDELRVYAASALLELRNETWRNDDPVIDAETFAERMTPESFGVNEDGSVSVFFHDGDLFWGHSIIVALDEKLTPIDAEIAG